MPVITDELTSGMVSAGPKLTALSQDRLCLQTGGAHLVSLDSLGEIFGDESRRCVAVGMTLVESPPLKFLMLLTPESRSAIAQSIMPQEGMDAELENSILQEVGNILGSTVANTLAAVLEQPVTTSIPEVVCDLSGAILSAAICGMEDIDEEIMILGSRLRAQERLVDCHLCLLYDHALGSSIAARNSTRCAQEECR